MKTTPETTKQMTSIEAFDRAISALNARVAAIEKNKLQKMRDGSLIDRLLAEGLANDQLAISVLITLRKALSPARPMIDSEEVAKMVHFGHYYDHPPRRHIEQIGINVRQVGQNKAMHEYIALLADEIRITNQFLSECKP